MLKIEFKTANEAFADDNKGDECARILEHVAGLLREGYTSGPLQDTNGNTVGRWHVDDED